MLRRKKTKKVKLFQTNGLQAKVPCTLGSSVMFGTKLAEHLVAMGFTPLRLLVKLMSPIKFFLIDRDIP